MAEAKQMQMFTRGQPGDADTRGESLVQKHQNKVQQELEEAAMGKLSALMPQMGDMVRALALAKANWDVDTALGMLRQFQVANLDHLNALSKKRKRIQEAMEAEAEGDEEEASSSGSESDGSSSSSDSEGDRKSRKKKKSSKDSKKHKRSKDKGKDKKKRKQKEKKKKKKKKKQKHGSGSEEEEDGRKQLAHSKDYGRFGVIRESDANAKRNEFVLWATDEKKVNVELLAQWEEKELFAEYMEDYNTGTLPHRKYYDLEAYARHQAEKEAKGEGEKPRKSAAVTDEEALRQQRNVERQKAAEERYQQALAELKSSGKAADMRQQELLRAEMALAYKTGDKAKAQRLFERLAPDEKK